MAPRFVLIGWLLLAAPVFAQPVNATRLRGEADAIRTRKRLTEAQQKLTDGKPAEAADDLQKILDESGDDLVLVKDDNYQPARRLVQQYLAALPTDALTAFRNRIDAPAKKLLEAGRTKRDPQPLLELLGRYFVSRPAEEALLLLGELEFERGDFTAAERHWRRLLPDGPADDLKYPGPKTDPAVVRAKLILAQIFRGDRTQAEAELGRYRTAHPKASGPLAGVTGTYADTLAKLTATPPKVPSDATGWTAFAGNVSRDGKPDRTVPRYWHGRPEWKTLIPRDEQDVKVDQPKPPSFHDSRPLAFHPVVLNGFAYIADAGRVYQFDLKTGAARLAFHHATLNDPPEIKAPFLALPCLLDADFTLTVANGKLYARLGPPTMPTGTEEKKERPRTYLVALEPKPAHQIDADSLTLTARWQVPPPVGFDGIAAWEGAPVVANGRVYAALLRVDGNRLIHALACYPEGGTKPLWVADVCDSDANRVVGVRNRQEVLTLAGPNVLFASHTGVTVAVNATTGKPAWAFRNPPANRPPATIPRDLCPPVYSDGTVFLAPADGDAVYALDAETGRHLWSSASGLHVVHLLGVTNGRLVAAVYGPANGLLGNSIRSVYGFDVLTGRTEGERGWNQPLDSFGRGIAGSNLILWPSKSRSGPADYPHRLYLLDPISGRPVRHLDGEFGNMAYADGVMLAATAKALIAYKFDDLIDDPRPPLQPTPLYGVNVPAFDPKPVVPPVRTAFDAVAAPSLTAPADVVREAALPPGAVPLHPLGQPSDTRLALCDGRALFAVALASGETTWRVPLDSPAALTHAAYATADRVIAVGPRAAVSAKSGRVQWEFRVPDYEPQPELSAFTVVGSRLVMRLGERCLIALDLGSGKIAWVRDALDRSRYSGEGFDSSPRFGPLLGASGRTVIAQRDEASWFLNAGTGEVERREPDRGVNWVSPPATFRADRLLIPDDSGAVVAWAGKQQAWRFDPARPASWTGTPPAFRVFDDDVLVSVSRNYGCELQRLTDDKAGGVWKNPRFLPVGAVHLSHADADPDRFYLPTDSGLYAVDRRTGREQWKAELPTLPTGHNWRVRAGRRTVIVSPTAALPSEDLGTVLERTLTRLSRSPTLFGMAGLLVSPFDVITNQTFPVLLFDPDSGRLEQRIDLPTVGPTAVVCLHAETAAVATTGHLTWLKAK